MVLRVAAANIGVKTGASPVITSLAETKTNTVLIANTAPADITAAVDMRARTAKRNTVAAAPAGTRRKVAETKRKIPAGTRRKITGTRRKTAKSRRKIRETRIKKSETKRKKAKARKKRAKTETKKDTEVNLVPQIKTRCDTRRKKKAQVRPKTFQPNLRSKIQWRSVRAS